MMLTSDAGSIEMSAMHKMPLGEQLVPAGLVIEVQMDLARQQRQGGRLAQIVVQPGFGAPEGVPMHPEGMDENSPRHPDPMREFHAGVEFSWTHFREILPDYQRLTFWMSLWWGQEMVQSFSTRSGCLSPPIYRWGSGHEWSESRQGRQKVAV